MMTVARVVVTLRHRLKLLTGHHPSVYFSLASLERGKQDLMVRRNTEIVIEGFPRSANTFALLALAQAQPRPLRVAHHLHVPAQLLRAAQWGIPSMLLIRDPADAIVSQLFRRPLMTARDCLQEYVWFYESVLPVVPSCVVATFAAVTTAYDTVVREVNRRYNMQLAVFDPTAENTRAVFNLVDIRAAAAGRSKWQVSRPVQDRKANSAQLRASLEVPRLRSLLTDARQLFTAISGAATPT
jgi:hypothetical protein